jgi:hypothetical protein
MIKFANSFPSLTTTQALGRLIPAPVLFLRPSDVVRRLWCEVRLQQQPERPQPLADHAPCMLSEFRKRPHSAKTQSGASVPQVLESTLNSRCVSARSVRTWTCLRAVPQCSARARAAASTCGSPGHRTTGPCKGRRRRGAGDRRDAAKL